MLLRPASLALLAGLTLAAPAAIADGSAPIAAEQVSNGSLVTPQAPSAPQADQSAASTYAQREVQHQDAAKFHGGSVVVVGISGGALIVILILLLLLV